MAYSPAFQFYYKDFREDPKTIRMDATEIGVYWLLIMECWDRDNKMPNDLEFLADIARMDVEEFEPIWKKRVAKCFVINEQKNTVSHKRIAKEILKQKNWKKKKSDAGKQGAAKRWNESVSDDGSAMAVLSSAIADDSSSSSFSSSSSKNGESPPDFKSAADDPLIKQTEEVLNFQIDAPSQMVLVEAIPPPLIAEWVQFVKNRMVGNYDEPPNFIRKKIGYWVGDFRKEHKADLQQLPKTNGKPNVCDRCRQTNGLIDEDGWQKCKHGEK